MSLPIELDAREVLEHLRYLGYEHITKDQLKLFIKDLKKLIKHDLRKLQAQQVDQENKSTDEKPMSSSECPIQRRVLCEINRAEKPYEETKFKSIAVQTQTQNIHDTVDVGGTVSVQSKSLGSDTSSPPPGNSSTKCSCSKTVSCPCRQQKTTQKTSNKKENSSKPISSFIKVIPSEGKIGKTDPVTLYHYYQTIWARQNRPGENPHADVRWRIRHKMMAPTALKTAPDLRRENPPWVE